MNLHQDEWLTARFGKPVFRLDTKEGECPEMPSGCFAYAKVDVSAIGTAAQLTGKNFFLADTNVSFSRQGARFPEAAGMRITVRPARADDEQVVRDIAATSFVFSRFHADPWVSNDLANIIKADWAGNFFSGSRGDEMLVAEKEGEIIGFCQVLGKDDKAIIDLIAVLSQYQRMGAGRAMITDLLARYKTVNVGTQLANSHSIALYERMGFCLSSAQYVFHYHSERVAG